MLTLLLVAQSRVGLWHRQDDHSLLGLITLLLRQSTAHEVECIHRVLQTKRTLHNVDELIETILVIVELFAAEARQSVHVLIGHDQPI